MNNKTIEIGALVISNCGRDNGKKYLVVGYAEQSMFVLCCDGNYRKQTNPKKKRIKHVKVYGIVESIQQKIQNNQKVFDSEIYSAISSFEIDS
ncbi:MAG: KOW domain-containing RNA-binding protein [Firmicutes bacterium]|nr:KOW domain-containing RNA-binding protein [Bacillota bacterium]MCL1954196.1 KOW domain-containing RNA-binding protein [Bacillota bacterium]